ncbi:flagellar basal body L-ring protein FlgH [Flocculibacter collagenilyticus]|uniref:flagellar basal body L-ring protein FlgH n=1 Tax=Flocculibacter collagenilyticus TaxID=2744479 RepID=UPI0018F522BE|nr:flagellar basal body L-ring protein FlgH [Flocculibacter collagenilyticus]
MYLFKVLLVGVLLFASVNISATSLYNEKTFKSLHADKKAFKVGDGITVLIYQSVQAKSSAGEGSSGDFKFSGGATVQDRNWNAGMNLGSSNKGDAATNRNGFVRAQLTAMVVNVGDNGLLFIEGSQKITVNDEEQIIAVKGTIRTEDISNQNTIASYRIQNAEIAIDGQGEVSSGKNGNVFSRLVNWIGL